MTEGDLVLDASAMVDLLIGSEPARAVSARLRGRRIHVPAHFDAEVLSALGRLERAGGLSTDDVDARLGRLVAAPFERHPLEPLLGGAWQRRGNVRLLDALYLVLAQRLGATLLSTDRRLAAASPLIEVVAGERVAPEVGGATSPPAPSVVRSAGRGL
jgi:predicted nucleic acid-binding protein